MNEDTISTHSTIQNPYLIYLINDIPINKNFVERYSINRYTGAYELTKEEVLFLSLKYSIACEDESPYKRIYFRDPSTFLNLVTILNDMRPE